MNCAMVSSSFMVMLECISHGTLASSRESCFQTCCAVSLHILGLPAKCLRLARMVTLVTNCFSINF